MGIGTSQPTRPGTGGGASGATPSQAAAIDKATAAVGFTGTYRGEWSAPTLYAVGDVVTAENGLIRCTSPHTSNAAGFRYNRNRWEPVPIPGLNGGTVVPVRQLDLSNPGAAVGAGLPLGVGLNQRRPRQFNYSQERVIALWDAPVDVTVAGSGVTAAAGSWPGGSVKVTSTGAATAVVTYTFPSPVDLSGGVHLRLPVELAAAAARYFVVSLTSAGTTYTNKLETQLLANEVPSGVRANYSIPLTDMTVVGTGANLAAITSIRFELAGGAGTFEISKLATHPNVSAKAKAVLWFDDGNLAGQTAAIGIAAQYGLPVTLAYIADTFTAAGSTLSPDNARYVQDSLGGQIAVHAYGAVDHNDTVMTPAQHFEEFLAYQHFGAAMGFHGVEDLAYFNAGFPGINSAARDLIVKRLFRSARTTNGRYAETLPPGNPGATRAFQMGAGNTSAGHFQPFATKAINCKGLAQFVWHALDATALAEFTTFCAWLDANRASIEVGTPQRVYDPLCL